MFINLKRVEYIITYACTGKCKHCSVGDKWKEPGHIQYEKMQGVLTWLCSQYDISSVMCFGGEPLLFNQEVEGIMNEANRCKIEKRQLITNGFFCKDSGTIQNVADMIENSSVNDILLSVDAFHQESIPVDLVYEFARVIKKREKKNIRLHPAWVIDQDNDNQWNRKTKQILNQFEDLEIPITQGNNIFPSGNAAIYLTEFYPKREIDLTYRCGQSAYSTELNNVDTISILPNGEVCVCCFPIGNVYEEEISVILERYNPEQIPMMKLLMGEGVNGLLHYADSNGITIEMDKHYSACDICREIVTKTKFK